MSQEAGSDPIGGRSVSVSTSQASQNSQVQTPTGRSDLALLSDEERQILLQQALAAEGLADAPRITDENTGKDFPFGATAGALASRNSFLEALSANFLKPVNTEGVPTNEKQRRIDEIAFRQQVLNEKAKLNPFQKKINDLESRGVGVYAGDALDIARSNFDRQVGNERATLQAESLILRSELGDPEARQQLQLTGFEGATKSFSDGGGIETLSGDVLGRNFEIFTPKETLTPTEQQRAEEIDQEIARLNARLAGGYTRDTGRARRVVRFFGKNQVQYGNEADHWANGLGQQREALANEKKYLVNNVRNATTEERTHKGAGLSRRTGKPASLHAILSTWQAMLGLPQFSGKRGTAPVLKAKVDQLSKVQQERVRDETRATQRVTDIKKIEADKGLTRLEKARAIRELNKPGQITNEQFEASRSGVAAQAVNLPSSVTTRSVQDYIDIGRRIRERMASV